VSLWDARDGRSLPPLRGHNDFPLSLAFSPDGRRLISGSNDTTGLVWDVADLPPPRPRVHLSPTDLDAAWASLADADARAAYAALLNLTDDPAAAVPFLRERLKPAAAADAARVQQLLADLDGERFADREKATAALASMDTQAEPALRQLLAGNASAESRRRAEQLLARLEGPLTDAERLREIRAVEALERMATPDARSLLAALAGAPADSRFVRDAKTSLARIGSLRPVRND
jgi:WD domain, G-beta repeat